MACCFNYRCLLNFVGSVYREVRQALIDMDQMFTLTKQRPKIEDNAGAKELSLKGCDIEFKDIKFAYPEAKERNIFDGLTFNVSRIRIALSFCRFLFFFAITANTESLSVHLLLGTSGKYCSSCRW